MASDASFQLVGKDMAFAMANKQTDAPTIFVDSLSTLIIDESIAKIGLMEILPGDGIAEGRFVLNLAINRQGARKIGEAILDALNRMEQATLADGQ